MQRAIRNSTKLSRTFVEVFIAFRLIRFSEIMIYACSGDGGEENSSFFPKCHAFEYNSSIKHPHYIIYQFTRAIYSIHTYSLFSATLRP